MYIYELKCSGTCTEIKCTSSGPEIGSWTVLLHGLEWIRYQTEPLAMYQNGPWIEVDSS